MSDLALGLIWFVPSLVFLILISLKVFDEDKKVDISKFLDTVYKARGGLFVLLLVFLSVKIENTLKDFYPIGIKATEWFYQVEGVQHIVFLQNHLGHYLLVNTASIFYILGLTYFVVFTPVFFLARADKEHFNMFSKLLMVNYFFILPGYFIFYVKVTSLYAPEVSPIMYSNDQYYAILHLINRLSNSFPSGHISISLSITLFTLLKAKLKRFGYFGIIFTIMTGFVIIYLGVHWVLDIPAGFLIGIFAYWSVTRGKWDFLFEPIIEFFEEKTKDLG
ncbi:MAG: phosphatase PAP2 family protein [Candidatus Saliniplasma sp.]